MKYYKNRKVILNYILKSIVFLWGQSWLFSSHYCNPQCQMIQKPFFLQRYLIKIYIYIKVAILLSFWIKLLHPCWIKVVFFFYKQSDHISVSQQFITKHQWLVHSLYGQTYWDTPFFRKEKGTSKLWQQRWKHNSRTYIFLFPPLLQPFWSVWNDCTHMYKSLVFGDEF